MNNKYHELIYDWNSHAPCFSKKPEHPIEIVDDTLRDGLQSPSVKNPTLEEKIDILQWMDKIDIDVAPIGIPARGKVHYDEVLELTKACLQNKLKLQLLCGARTLKQDVKPIIEIVQRTGCAIETLIFVGSSAIRQEVENWSLDNLVENIEKSVSFAVKNDLKVTFATEDTMRTHPKRLEKFYLTAVDCGVETICLSDTVGSVTPDGVFNIVEFMRNLLTVRGLNKIKIHFHGHMDRGLGVWNSIAALSAGASRVDGCILGIGERCGNTPMEQLLTNLKLMGWIDKDLTYLREYSQAVSKYLEVPVPFHYPVVGSDAFRTSSGIHTAAILKAFENNDEWLANRVYSPYPPQLVGRELSIAVGPMSGKSNAVYWLKKNNFPVNDDMIEKILNRARESDRVLKDEEIMEVIKDNQ